jgi:OmpA-OmpF porin, OOP family
MTPVARLAAFAVLSILAAVPASAQGACKDYPGITRMPQMHIADCDEKQFDSYNFPVGPAGKEVDQTQEGRYFRIAYEQDNGAPEASMVQIVRNMQNAAKAAGGQVLADAHGDNWYNATLKLAKNGKEIWGQVKARGGSYELFIIEKQGMQQDVVMDAKAMGNSLRDTGKVAIYGIYFDTGKSNLKPESDAALNQIATLLKQMPALKVFVVGHTDMAGDPTANVKLSQDRAQAVIVALTTQYGVAAARLKAFGAGPYAPAASNRSEDGRAKNRRVELVEIATK